MTKNNIPEKNRYKSIEKKYGKKVANRYWAKKKERERLEQLDRDHPEDKSVFDKGQISSHTGGAFINKRVKNND